MESLLSNLFLLYTILMIVQSSTGKNEADCRLDDQHEGVDLVAGIDVDRNQSNLHFEWKPSSNGTIQYKVGYKIKHPSSGRYISNDWSEKSEININVTQFDKGTLLEVALTIKAKKRDEGDQKVRRTEARYSFAVGESKAVVAISDLQTTVSEDKGYVHLSWCQPLEKVEDIEYAVKVKLMDKGQCGTTNAKQTQEKELRNSTKGTDLPDVMSTFNWYAYSKYRFFVTANTADESATLYIDTITPEREPKSKPQDVQLSNATDTSLSFSWNVLPCKGRKGDIIRYEYVIQVMQDSGQYKEISAGDINVTTCLVTIGNLTCRRDYKFEVAGTNSAGTGPYAKLDATTLTRPPGAVQSLSVNATTPYECYVTWQMPADIGCPEGILTYDVRYKIIGPNSCGDEDNPSANETLTGIQNTYITIHGLQPFSGYDVFVTARNGEDSGQSEMRHIVTKKSAPDAVRELRINALSTSDLNITWIAPSYKGCPIERVTYDVKYYVIDKASCAKAESSEANNGTLRGILATNVTISGLYPNSTYAVIVTAITDVTGKSVMRNGSTLAYEPEGPPHEVSLVLASSTSRSLQFQWNQPSCNETNGIINNYTYRLTNSRTAEQTGTTVETSYNFTDLIPYVNYTFTVAASTIVGMGPYSDDVVGMTKEDKPPPPINLLVLDKYTTNTSITVTWNEPEPPYGIIDRYLVRYLKNGGNSSTVIATSTMATIHNLQPYANYSFKVRAFTGAGKGPLSVATSAKTKEGKRVSQTDRDKALEPSASKEDNMDRIPLVMNYHPSNIPIRHTIFRNFNILQTHSSTKYIFSKPPITAYRRERNIRYHVVHTSDLQPTPGTNPSKRLRLPTGPPVNVTLRTSLKRMLAFQWGLPNRNERSGIIIGYQYRFTNMRTGLPEMNTVNGTEKAFEGLTPYVNYTFEVGAMTKIGIGPYSRAVIARTLEARPPAPDNITLVYANSTSVTIAWPEPNPPRGIITKYDIEYWKKTKNDSADWTNDVTVTSVFTHTTIDELDSDTNYTIKVAFRPIEKQYDNSFQPDSAKFENRTKNCEYGEEDSKLDVLLESLLPSTKYEILVSASTSAGSGAYARIEISTMPATGISFIVRSYQVKVVKQQEVPSKRSTKDIMTYINSPDDYIAAEISKNDVNKPFIVGDNMTYESYYNAPLQHGVACEIVVGAVSKTTNESYVAWGEAMIFNGNQNAKNAAQNTNAVAGATVPIVLLLIVLMVIVGIIYKQRRTKSQSQNIDESPIELNQHTGDNRDQSILGTDGKATPKLVRVFPAAASKSQTKKDTTPVHTTQVVSVKPIQQQECLKFKAVPIHRLCEYIRTKRTRFGRDDVEPTDDIGDDDIGGFEEEYNSIPFGQTHRWHVSQHPSNIKKNRYTNIAAYDHSRVKLQPVEGKAHTDYINACHVKGYKTKTYIACQGPLPTTIADMWRMIWEQNSAKVIMLTNLKEKGKLKCEQYWPGVLNKEDMHGDIGVKLIQEECYGSYIIRTFKIRKGDDIPVRDFKQFHYTTWPDMGVPQYATPLLTFMKVAQAYPQEGAGPDIVHCSAGVGRTGTYIVIEAMLEMAKEEKKVDVHAMVSQLRKDRIQMVQTEVQYEFIFDAVVESIFCGDTSIMITDIRSKLASLLTKNKKTGKSRLEEQFETLDLLTDALPPSACKGGKADENVDKTRYQDKIPADRFRPYLMSPGKAGSTNYINAAFIDGYKGKAMYLGTQMPLPNTVDDIWRLVYDYESTTIVMLNAASHSDPTVAQYWPESGSQMMGEIKVTLKSTTTYQDDIIGRTFDVQFCDSTMTVEQLQFLGWASGDDVPDKVESLVVLANLVQEKHKDGPITVHCLDGVGRSGTFCALMSELDRINEEKMIDVFQSVRGMRKCRPGMVETLGQYKMLYEAVQANLEEYSIYENFNP
ncbi:receptor-type tyrosine-protein phosphatase T-like [Amphiura filiformis]|uniref:receptor-type tyrosine-protein phosphatase T-like n=1 Tax=Amphiura filiformis TaxID=82378 RepID=UPI003B2278B6